MVLVVSVADGAPQISSLSQLPNFYVYLCIVKTSIVLIVTGMSVILPSTIHDEMYKRTQIIYFAQFLLITRAVIILVSVSGSYQIALRYIRYHISGISTVTDIQYCATDFALAGLVKYFHTSML